MAFSVSPTEIRCPSSPYMIPNRYKMLLLLVAVLSVASSTDGLTRCFECTDSPHPADCTRTTLCSHDQQCSLKQYITSGGLVLYSSGCLSKSWCGTLGKREANTPLSKRADIVTCQDCCTGELCNNQGCGVIALSQPQRGPYCFDCPVLENPSACRTLRVCPAGNICMLQGLTTSSGSGNTVYASSCVSVFDCHAHNRLQPIGKRDSVLQPIGKRDSVLQPIGKRSRHQRSTCHTCCDTDFCNDHCATIVTTTPSYNILSSTTSLRPTIGMTSSAAPTTSTVPATTIDMNLVKADCEHGGYTFVEPLRFCFKFHNAQHKSWNKGNARCKEEGGTLGVLDTEAKWNFIKTAAGTHSHYHGHRIYIGLIDEHRTNNFTWADGSTVFSFSAWGRHQPTDGHDQCVVLHTDDSFKWHDTPCTDEYSYICTKTVL